jgi:integral membrane protein
LFSLRRRRSRLGRRTQGRRPMKNPIPILRTTALIEGVSFLILLGVAVPLKYLAGMPQAVKVAGWTHGLLFIAFCAALVHTASAARWPAARTATIFVAALLPFGPFVVDRRMKQYQQEFRDTAEE